MSVRFRIIDRRQLLASGAAFLGVSACDTLVLPDAAALEGLEPITPNDDFYVTSISRPNVNGKTWTLEIRDGETLLATIDRDFLESVDARDTERTLECIGSSESNQAIGNAIWSGLPLPELLALVGVTLREDALEIVMTGADDYETSLPRTDVDRPMWLVWRMNDEPLPRDHGAPARLLAPSRYGTKNVKWLTKLRLVDSPFVGFWESRGWSNDATYRANTFVKSPASRTTVTGGGRLLGTAFAGEDPIVAVMITTDGGATWVEAELTYAPGPGIWALWRYDWEAAPGDYVVMARCVTASGATSNDQGGRSLEGYDASMQIEVRVE